MKICILFLLFLIYSIIGWLVEVMYTSVLDKKVINRGFLMGPYCPIYGIGCVLMIILLNKYKQDLIILFIMSMLMCALLEYLTSYFLEKLFNARWWDYSKRRFNINGRICLETLVPFGILGCIVIKIINPFLVNLLSKIPLLLLLSLFVLVGILFMIDVVVSSCIIAKLRFSTIEVVSDNTEEITKLVREYIAKNSKYGKRLMDAFPKLKVIKNTKNIKK